MVLKWGMLEASDTQIFFLKMAFIKENEKEYFNKSKNIQKIREIINNNSNWDSMKATDMILSPFNYITGFSEMDSTTSGMVFGAWIWLYALVTNSTIIDEKSQRCFELFFSNASKNIRRIILWCVVF